MTIKEYNQGFVVCDCGKFAHVIKTSVVLALKDGYRGELCPECSLWMCSLDKLREAGFDIPAVNNGNKVETAEEKGV